MSQSNTFGSSGGSSSELTALVYSDEKLLIFSKDFAAESSFKGNTNVRCKHKKVVLCELLFRLI